MNSTTLRDRASELARTDTAGAADVAKEIEDPWFRSQALAWIARYAKRGVVDFAKQAVDAAAECEDPFQQAGACAWAIRALMERDRRDVALTMLEIALAAVPRIERAASRSEALFLLFNAVFDASSEIRRSMLFALSEIYDEDPHWRVVRNFRDALTMAKAEEPELVAKLARCSEAIERRVQEESLEPRPFFW